MTDTPTQGCECWTRPPEQADAGCKCSCHATDGMRKEPRSNSEIVEEILDQVVDVPMGPLIFIFNAFVKALDEAEQRGFERGVQQSHAKLLDMDVRLSASPHKDPLRTIPVIKGTILAACASVLSLLPKAEQEKP